MYYVCVCVCVYIYIYIYIYIYHTAVSQELYFHVTVVLDVHPIKTVSKMAASNLNKKCALCRFFRSLPR